MAKQERRLNKRFVTILTIGVMVVLTIVIGLMIFATANKDPQVYADRAESFMAKGNFKEAAKNFASAYRYSNKDPKWLVKVADAQYQDGNERAALGSLHTAVTADPSLWEAQKRLLEIYYEFMGRNALASIMKNMEEESDRLIKMISPKEAEKNAEMKKALALGYHCRGVARYGRRAEDPNLEKQSREDINKAIEMDPKAEYVESLALMTLDEAQQMMRAARSDEITTEAYDQFVVKMREKIRDAEVLYLDLAKKASGDYEAFLNLGNFYLQKWATMEGSVGEFCKMQGERRQNGLTDLNRQMQEIADAKTASADDRARARQRVTAQISQWRREIPEWSKRSKDHEAQAKKCNERAEGFYKNAVALAKKNDEKSKASMALAMYYLANNRLTDAEKLVRETIQIDPLGYQSYQLLADILKRTAGPKKEGKSQAKIDEAIALLDKRIKGPHKLEGPKGRQNQLFRLNLVGALVELYLDRNGPEDLKRADQMLKELDQPELASSPVVYQLRARRVLAANDYVQGLKFLEKADSLSNERDPRIKLALAELYSRRGDIGASRKAVEAALSMVPDAMIAWRMAATVYQQTGDNAKALSYANRVLAVPGQEKDIATLKVKLQAQIQLGQLAEADETAKEIKVLGGGDDWPVQKARLLLTQGKGVEAEQLLKEVLRSTPGDKTATAYLVDYLVDKERLEEAQAYVKTAVEKHPGDKSLVRLQELVGIKDAKERAARLKAMTEEVKKERQAVDLAQAEETKDPFVRAVKLFDHYARSDDLANAKKYLEEAVKLNAKRANPISFRYALIKKDWDLARKCTDFARVENLDSAKGATYEVQLANSQGWDLMTKAKAERGKKNEGEANRLEAEGRKMFGESARAAEQILADLPNDSQAHALLGEAYFWLDRKSEASSHIGKALELNPMNPYAKRGMSLQQWEEINAQGSAVSQEVIRDFAENVTQAMQQLPWDEWLKDKLEFLRKQVEKQKEYVADERGDVKEVLSRREKVRKENPGDTDNLLRLAWIYEFREEVRSIEKAEECYRQALSKKLTGDIVQLYMKFAGRAKRQSQMESFLKDLASSEAKTGKSVGYSILAYYYLTGNNVKEAEKAFLEAVKVEDVAPKRMDMAVFYSRIGNLKETVNWCRKTLEMKAPEQDKSARFLMINSLLSLGDWTEAKTQIDEYGKTYNDVDGQIFQARLAMGQNQMPDAERILTEIVEKSPNNLEALDYRSIVYLYSWKLEKAREDLERIQKANPRDFGLPGRIKLVKLQCELGRTTDAERDARDLILQALRAGPEWVERIRVDLLPPLASAMSEKNYDELLTWANNMAKGYWGWLYERGQFHVMRGKYQQAEESLAQAWKAVEGLPKAPVGLKLMILDSYLSALYKLGASNPVAYGKIIQAADKATQSLSMESPRILGWQAAAYYANGQKQKGQTIFLKALGLTGQNYLGVWQLTRNTMLNAVSPKDLVQMLEAALPSAGQAKEAVQVALASSHFAADDLERGAAVYKQLVASVSDAKAKAMVLYILGQEYTEKHKYAEAAEALVQARQVGGDNLAILNNLAYLMEEYLNKAEDAYKLIQGVFNQAPNNPDLLDTYGQILFKTGKTDEGMYQLTKSVWIRESSASRYHLGLMLMKQNRQSEGEMQLRRALQLVGEDKVLEKQIRDALSKS